MADLNPFKLWHRILALPADSQTKTIAMAFVVSATAALFVSIAAVSLQPLINANKLAERQAKLDEMIASLPGLAEVLAESNAETLDTVIVDLTTGLADDSLDVATFDMAAIAADPATSIVLSDEQDIAGIKTRPNFAQIYVLKSGDALELVILPIYAAGYQSQINAYLALKGDLNTVAALVITEQGETPGLGAKIAEPAWQALWPGKEITDADGTVKLAVVRGGASSTFEVDGITGATRTSSAVSAMIGFWMGPQGYAKVLFALRNGEV